MVDRSYIRVKAMVTLIDPIHDRQLVTRFPADPDVPIDFHRLIGGSVEFGELARDAAVREVSEEVGLRLDPDALTDLGVVESVFEFQGESGHEVVFLYSTRVSPDLVPDEGAWSEEADGSPMRLEWRPLAPSDSPPLYPVDPAGREARSYP